MAKKRSISLPAQRDLKRFVEILHKTGDPALAYMAMRPHGRRETAEKRGPELAAHPKVKQILEKLEGPPEALSDDERMCHHALALADDPDLSPRERLEAMKTYDRLRKSVKEQGLKPGGFAPELRAFLRDQGVDVDL